MRVVDTAGHAPYSNLYAAGGILAGALRWTEKSGEGIALASAVAAADSILKGA
jgi:glycerol-3-phosphate dehydrogenase subunit B